MPWQLIGTIVSQFVVAAYVYGQLTQRQKDQGGWLRAHEDKLTKHEEQLLLHEGRLSKTEGRLFIV